mmetsp:Transcript_50722/g.126266  ORF Transcript_50722/g.126266 Transcript_50722/m.126266 type:complete len:321 (+) Transcript_50722:264-1226(+)
MRALEGYALAGTTVSAAPLGLRFVVAPGAQGVPPAVLADSNDVGAELKTTAGGGASPPAEELEVAPLGESVNLLCRLVVQTHGARLDELKKPVRPGALAPGFTPRGEGGEGGLKESVHLFNVGNKVLELSLEGGEGGGDYAALVSATLCDQIALLLDAGPDEGEDQVGVDAVVALHEDRPQLGRHEPPPLRDLHVVALADVVDVGGDGGVGADAVLLHERDELRLGQVPRGLRLALPQRKVLLRELDRLPDPELWHAALLPPLVVVVIVVSVLWLVVVPHRHDSHPPWLDHDPPPRHKLLAGPRRLHPRLEVYGIRRHRG